VAAVGSIYPPLTLLMAIGLSHRYPLSSRASFAPRWVVIDMFNRLCYEFLFFRLGKVVYRHSSRGHAH
jgi:hypothetical protein